MRHRTRRFVIFLFAVTASTASGQAPDQGGEYRSVCPVHAWSGVGAAEEGDLVPQHKEFDVLGGGRADRQ